MKPSQIKSTILILMFLIYGLSACAKDPEPSTQKDQKSQSPSDIRQSLEKHAEKRLIADIDGDNKNDTIYFITKTKVSPITLLDKAEIVQPFYTEKDLDGNLQHGSKHVLIFSLSSSPTPIVIHDSNEISVLDTEAASSVLTISNKDLNSILIDDNANSAGEGIILPTEAGIDIYLYWNGKSIALYEPMDMP